MQILKNEKNRNHLNLEFFGLTHTKTFEKNYV
jgi:hypothetical protein